jgi:hypothetical protein
MCSKNSRLILIIVCFCSACICKAQSLNLKGGAVARPGYTSALQLEIVRGELSGPVRFSMPLPANWKVEAPYESKSVSLLPSRDELQLVWLDFPLQDTLRYMLGFNLPNDQQLEPVTLTGSLNYFDSNGTLRKVSPASHTFKVLRYFSRYQ